MEPSTQPRSSTSEIEMIASRVVENQARVCAVKMTNVETKLAELSKAIERLDTKLDKLQEKQALRAEELDRKFTVLDGRWKIYPILVGVLGAIGGVIGIITAIMERTP